MGLYHTSKGLDALRGSPLVRFPPTCVGGLPSTASFYTSSWAQSHLEVTPSSEHYQKYNPNLFWNVSHRVDSASIPPNTPGPANSKAAGKTSTLSASGQTSESSEGKEPGKETKPTLWQRAKKEIVHYYHGFRLLGLEIKIASGITFRLLGGKSLTRRERKQLVRTAADLIRTVPFILFVVVPFLELLLPVYLKFFPFMLPSTFKDQSAEDAKIRQKLKAKLELARFLQETLHQTTESALANEQSPKYEEFQAFLKKVQTDGQPTDIEEIVRFSKLFEDQMTLESLEPKQLKTLCRILSLPTIGPSNLLRFQLGMRVRQLKAEDRLLAREGVDQIPSWELQSLCQDRGMRSAGLTQDRLRAQLGQWLNLSLEKNVPVTLLLFSHAISATRRAVEQFPIKEAIAQLPPAASEEVTARVLESIPPSELDVKLKLEVLRKEQANIKAARAQLKQELAEQQKTAAAAAADAKMTPKEPGTVGVEANSQSAVEGAPKKDDTEILIDQAPTLKETLKEALEGTETVHSEAISKQIPEPFVDSKAKVTTESLASTVTYEPKTEMTSPKEATPSDVEVATHDAGEPELTTEDLAHIESALAESSKKETLAKESLQDLQAKVAETAETLQKHGETMATAKPVDKKTSKAAALLEARVNRLIGEMDDMVNELGQKREALVDEIKAREVDAKQSSEPKEQSKFLDVIQADKDELVDIDELMRGLRRIKKVTGDETRWHKILDLLDQDHDGKIDLQDILSLKDIQVRLSLFACAIFRDLLRLCSVS
ncbi:unnamed protein product [Calicophoron daubneyi]|uniref:Mitochondrial proton/calcium exchanger protein n=1 Tax=Calicophoron daubneyi TaxID=300641 RepID=A0AAV2TSL0_CALDB